MAAILDERRQQVFLDRYALKGEDGNPLESRPEQMWKRLANYFGRSATETAEFMDALDGFRFVPSGRILAGGGVPGDLALTFYNCYVLAIESARMGLGNDSRGAIMSTLGLMVEILARGGGVGINWSTLRPNGARIRGVLGRSSGAVAWMRAADALSDQITQGGTRTAALMFVLEDWHPDIWEFLVSTFKRANISVGVSATFMAEVANALPHELEFPVTSDAHYDPAWDGDLRVWKMAGYEVAPHVTVSAVKLWDEIVQSAWRTGNPGLVFLDRCQELSNTAYMERVVCTNPCGEQPLPAGGCCNLGAINLMAHWDHGVRWGALRETARIGAAFLDAVIDAETPVSGPIGRVQLGTRRVGLGTMGLADLLLAAKVRYGSGESLALIRDIYTAIRDAAYESSADAAVRWGSASGFKATAFLSRPFVAKLPERLRGRIRSGIRNLALLSQAPTGTISTLAGVSSGIEPIFASSYTAGGALGCHLVEHPAWQGAKGAHLVTALELPVEEHIVVQAEIQALTDGAVSKTINLPADAPTSDVDRAFRLAYERGCKGTTAYREGSRGNLLDPTECPVCKV